MKRAPVVLIAALVTVAIVSGFMMYMAYWMTDVLAGPGFCAKALGAEQASKSSINTAASCVGLLTIQLKSLATNSHILFGMFALCLLVLIVIVIAGGELSFTASKSGVAGDIKGHTAERAAKETAQAAVDKAGEIADNADTGANHVD
jgi:hypothetical protein